MRNALMRPPRAAATPHLEAAARQAAPIRRNNPDGGVYTFKRYPFGELGTKLEPPVVDEIAAGLVDALKTFSGVTALVAPEPGGHTWGLVVAHLASLPLHILRQRTTHWRDEVGMSRRTAYSHGTLFGAELPRGQRIVVVDDVVSSGGTLAAIVGTLKAQGVDVAGAVVILSKARGAVRMTAQLEIPVVALLDEPATDEVGAKL